MPGIIHQKILIIGQPKSGTTALYTKIRNSLDMPCELFEPKNYEMHLDAVGKQIIAKVLLAPSDGLDLDSFDQFEKKILLVRDPRDRLISNVLYGIRHLNFRGEISKISALIEMLKEKESNPQKVSMLEIIRLQEKLSGNIGGRISRFDGMEYLALEYHDKHPEVCVFKYEDFIDGKLEELESFIGLNLYGDANVDVSLLRVVRTRGYGDWRHWFTPYDVDFFRTKFSAFMRRYKYEDDWSLNDHQVILPEHCSGYVVRLLQGSD